MCIDIHNMLYFLKVFTAVDPHIINTSTKVIVSVGLSVKTYTLI